jgi:isocitrate dehydrogenase
MYWARALAAQTSDPDLAARFTSVAVALKEAEESIAAEMLAAQGEPVDVGGYYLPDDAMANKAMRPSPTFNAIIDRLA